MTVDPLMPLRQFLDQLDVAMERAGLDVHRQKMIRSILIYGEPVTMAAPTEALPDVLDMKLALETVQTWFHMRPLSSPMLNADLLQAMVNAGYPIEGGVN